jgi:hypothetical protein
LSGLTALAPFTSLYLPARRPENAPATTTTPLGTGDYARIWRGLPDDRPPSWLYLAFAPALSERRHRGLARGS